jgi:DNA/RNA endonuclease YhcR with UshA esterase domain
MKTLYTFILSLLVLSASAQTIRQQSFEGTASDDWGYTTDPATFNTGSDVWDTVSSLNNITALPTDGSQFFGITDLESPNGTSSGQFGFIRLDTVHLNGTSAFITFDYQVDGFDSGDDIEYELWADGVSQGTVLLVDGFSNLDQQGMETVNIPANTDSIRFEIRVKQNGSDYGAIDNIRLETGAAPPPPLTPTYLIANINNVDTNGVADSLGVFCWTQGVVLGVNVRPSGLQFTIWDNEGIGIFNNTGNLGYTVMEGDSVMIRGTVSQFNGLTQINPDSVVLVNSGNPIPAPRVVTNLDETTESDLVRIDDVLITAVSGSNFDIATATDTLVMRVDSDTDVLDSLSFGVGDSLCYVIGIGGQFDNSSPYTSGYQVFPRYFMDVDTNCGTTPPTPVVPMYTISDINNVDTNGVADSLSVFCWTQGVVLGVNVRPSGLHSFTIWDNEGIGIFNNTGNLGYTVMEGDSVMIRGTISQFNGLTQINPDSVVLVNSGNPIPAPRVVTNLDETTESDLVRIDDVLITAVSGSNFDIATATDTLVMRVDSDTDVLDSLSFGVGDSLCYVIGMGGQFDNSSPYTSGYQVFPRYFMDVDTACGTTPPTPVVPMYPIADINNVDTNGVADSLGVLCWTQGVVLGVNIRPSGLQFTIWDNEGIGIFNNTGNLGYTVMEGDSVMIRGTISQFNGLTQINPDSVVLVNSGNPIPAPRVVTNLDETTESDLVRIDDVLITAVSGSNFDIATATDTLVMRVDSDTDVLDSLSFGVGDSLCYVIGMGGQFDNSSPYTSGYQVFPRYFMDVDTTCGGPTPPPPAAPFYPIADINNVDTNGVADSLGVVCWTKGVVIGVNIRPSGLQFTLWENEGINVFSFGPVSGYTVTEGDSLMVRGEIDQFNGLQEIIPDSIMVLNSGNPIPSPRLVSMLDESTESDYIRIENVLITAVNPTGTSGTNYDFATATDTLVMRVDNDTDVDDSLTLNVGDSLCYIVGTGGQFDGSNPYTSGYQIFPMRYSDIDTACGTPVPEPVIPMYAIADINNVDSDGVADSLGVRCWTKGIVLGVNLRPSGLQFTIWDVEGIGVFNSSGNLGYTVMEGDSIMIRGTVGQFNGLQQIGPDSIVLLNSGNTLPAVTTVTALDESTESSLIMLEDLLVVGQSGDNYDVFNGTDTFLLRVDQDTDIYDSITINIGDSICNATGIGGQFDGSSPYTSGYQILPRYFADVDTCSSGGISINGLTENENPFVAYPNPASGSELFFNKTVDVQVYNALGKMVMEARKVNFINIDELTSGVYIIRTFENEIVKVIVR